MFELFSLHHRKGCALTKIEIGPVVTIVINPRQTRSHEQVQMPLRRERGVMLKIQFDFTCYVDELWFITLRQDWATHKQAANQSCLN